MNHDSARLGIDSLFKGEGRKRAELRAHLDGCLECRAYYDRTVRAFRALAGRPEEMTSEEQWLFEPALPEGAIAPPRFPAFLYGGLATIGLAGLVLVLAQPKENEFSPRGGGKTALLPSARAICTRGGQAVGEAVLGACRPDDAVLFSITPSGQRYVAVVLIDGEKLETLVSGAQGAVAQGQPDLVLGQAATWRPGLKAVVTFSSTPIEPADAERCARGQCAELKHADVALSPAGPQ